LASPPELSKSMRILKALLSSYSDYTDALEP